MGLDNVSADVTIIDLTLRHQPNNDEPVAIHIRRVTRRPVNYAEVIEVDKVAFWQVTVKVGFTLDD